MLVDEIFKEISAHMIKGVMVHEQMADYYDFLNLHGFKKCHEYHSKCEMKNLRKLHKYYINHFNKLVPEDSIEDPQLIPSSWYKYSRQEVDPNTKRQAVKAGIEKWVAWETDTKNFYEQMYKELQDINEVAAAEKISCLIRDVDCELKWAQRKHISLATSDYDMGYILGQQDWLHDWFKERMHDKH